MGLDINVTQWTICSSNDGQSVRIHTLCNTLMKNPFFLWCNVQVLPGTYMHIHLLVADCRESAHSSGLRLKSALPLSTCSSCKDSVMICEYVVKTFSLIINTAVFLYFEHLLKGYLCSFLSLIMCKELKPSVFQSLLSIELRIAYVQCSLFIFEALQ